MHRAIQVSQVWNWLPAFRAVAETQHLPTAAQRLHVSPSALSRSIHLLEDRLGEQLFTRSGRELRLNSAGKALLSSVRDAMRRVDDGCSEATSPDLVGELHLSAMGALTSGFVLPALRDLRQRYPELEVHLHNHPAEVAQKALLQGDVDVAFHDVPVRNRALRTEPLGQATNGIYCGEGHPLFGTQTGPPHPELLRHPFAAPLDGSSDGWPGHLARRVEFFAAQMHVGVELCVSGDLLAVLPDVVARPWVERSLLWRLPLELIPPTPLFAVRRVPLTPGGCAKLVLEAVAERIHRTVAAPARAGSPCAPSEAP